jgi:hypothetical protein
MVITDSRIFKIHVLRQQQITTLIQSFVNVIQLIRKTKEHGNPIWRLVSLRKDNKITIEFCNGCETDRSMNSALSSIMVLCSHVSNTRFCSTSTKRRKKERKKDNNDFISSHFLQ